MYEKYTFMGRYKELITCLVAETVTLSGACHLGSPVSKRNFFAFLCNNTLGFVSGIKTTEQIAKKPPNIANNQKHFAHQSLSHFEAVYPSPSESRCDEASCYRTHNRTK